MRTVEQQPSARVRLQRVGTATPGRSRCGTRRPPGGSSTGCPGRARTPSIGRWVAAVVVDRTPRQSSLLCGVPEGVFELLGMGEERPSSSPRRPPAATSEDREDRRQGVDHERLERRPPDAEGAARPGVPGPHQQPEGGQREDRAPLGAAGQPEADPAGEPPGPPAAAADRPEVRRPSLRGRPGTRRAQPQPAPSPGRRPGSAPRTARRTPGRCRAGPAGTARTPGRRSTAAARRRSRAASSRSAGGPAGTSPAPSACRRPPTAIRQPNGVIPKILSPSAISHLPTSGCTTMLAPVVDRAREPAGQDLVGSRRAT